LDRIERKSLILRLAWRRRLPQQWGGAGEKQQLAARH